MSSYLPDIFNSHLKLLSHAKTVESWISDPEGITYVHLAFEVRSPAKMRFVVLTTLFQASKASSLCKNSLSYLLSDMQRIASDGSTVTAVILADSAVAHEALYSQRRIGASADQALDFFGNARTETFEKRGQASLPLPPACYPSNSSCNDATDTCHGHGTCYKKSGDCYACRCYGTYGGSACQKKDISSPFFLTVGVTLGMMVAIMAAVGMIFRVGDTELPGVISAGVGAAGVQK